MTYWVGHVDGSGLLHAWEEDGTWGMTGPHPPALCGRSDLEAGLTPLSNAFDSVTGFLEHEATCLDCATVVADRHSIPKDKLPDAFVRRLIRRGSIRVRARNADSSDESDEADAGECVEEIAGVPVLTPPDAGTVEVDGEHIPVSDVSIDCDADVEIVQEAVRRATERIEKMSKLKVVDESTGHPMCQTASLPETPKPED